MAIGMDKLAGPVSPGDIIMRNEEAPKGAAALLNKMINKGTRGMYKLPEEEKEMPGFMKDAMENMEEVKLDSSDFRTILKLLQQGFSMEDIENMTQASMTKDGPTKGLTMMDIANLDKAAVQGGKINFLGEQPTVDVPLRAQSHADSIPTELAYITDAEKDLLVKANIHGSMEGKPNEGPGGIASLDDFYTTPGGGIGGGSGEQVFSSGVDSGNQSSGNEQGGGGYQSAEAYGVNPGMVVDNDGQVYDQTQAGLSAGFSGQSLIPVSDEKQKALEALAAAKMGIQSGGTTIVDLMKSAGDKIKDLPLLALKGADALAEFLDARERQAVEDLFSGDVSDVGGGLGNVLRALKDDPTRANYYFDKYEDELETAMGQGSLEGAEGKKKLTGTAQDKVQALIDKYTGNDKFDKAFDPKNYYFDDKGNFKEGKKPKTAGDFKNLAELQAQGKIDFTRGNTQALEEGRRLLEQDRGANKPNTGQGTAAATTQAETVTETPDQSEYAGMFDVPGTMMFEGKEVPVGRRFSTNIGDVMKRALEGTSERQLEPFAQYVKRRRDFLGEEDDEFFDEDGNVIYGGVA
jgi:hypothetical protein